MGKKMDILTTLSKGIYIDDNYNVVDGQVVDMINEYYRRFKQDIEFQGRMSITILSLDNLDGDEGDKLRWEKIKEALPEVYNKDFVDFTLINCRNMQEIESSFVDHANFVYNTYNARTIIISRFEIFKDFLKSKNWTNQAQFIVWYDTKEEWEKSRIKTANYEDNLKIDDSVVVIDFDSLEDKINPYDIQKILNYRETNHKGKLTFILSDTKIVQEMYDILGLPCYYYKYISVIGEDSNKILKEDFQEIIKKFKSSFICMNEEFLKKCETKDVSRTVYTITNNGITLVKKPQEMPRLSRPHFGDKSDKIEHKAALSQRWYFLLQENTWRDKNGIKHFVPNMPENYIKNCILWLDETLCGKYIPDPELRKQFKSLFQNELSHRDTLKRLTSSSNISVKELLEGKRYQDLHSQMAIKCGIDVNDLPSMTKRADSQKYIIEDIVNQLKNFGTEEVIKHYQNKSALEKPYYYWRDLEEITSPFKGSTKIPIKVRMILNMIAHNNCKKIYEYKVGKESGRWSASEPQFLSKEKHNDFHTFDKKENDMISHPNHYAQTRIECIDAIEACIEPYQDTVDAYLTSNALKYLWRHEFKKNPIEDLKKAVWYINRIIEKYEKGEIKSQINKE